MNLFQSYTNYRLFQRLWMDYTIAKQWQLLTHQDIFLLLHLTEERLHLLWSTLMLLTDLDSHQLYYCYMHTWQSHLFILGDLW